MTAEVAILNTHGVALAADSAVTVSVGGEKKVYNTANKLFTLSKYHPVGIMIYNKATYMDIDWEIIIKEFRKTIKKDKPCETLFDYADSFIDYVKHLTFVTEKQQRETLFSICYHIITCIRDSFFYEVRKKFNDIENIELKQTTQVFNSVTKEIQVLQETLANKARYTLDLKSLKQYKNDIYEMIDDVFEEYKLSIRQKENVFKIIISDLNKANNIINHSGIVIAGYGNGEIFPSMYQCEICGKFGKSLILFNERKVSISHENAATIVPFAQSEMVHSFMTGIDPMFQETIDKQLEDFMMSLSEIIGGSYKDRLMQARKEFIDFLDNFKKEVYVNPVMNIVHSLQKSDLAEMAETLVNLTAFKRHVSKDAETVGGPTDVAIITKGDGFVWIKRKHYFDIKLNRFFQQNYFMEDENDQSL
jgi:hypothetical protein